MTQARLRHSQAHAHQYEGKASHVVPPIQDNSELKRHVAGGQTAAPTRVIPSCSRLVGARATAMVKPRITTTAISRRVVNRGSLMGVSLTSPERVGRDGT